MEDPFSVFIIALILLCFSPIILPTFAYTMYRAYRADRKGWLIVILISLILYLGFPLFQLQLIPGTSWYFDRQFTNQLTGLSFTLGEPLYAYETERDFNGDGYSIVVYQLSEEIIAEFDDPPRSFFTHPKQAGSRGEWQRQPWQKKQITEDMIPIIDFALGRAPEELEMRARASLEHPTTYYAYLCKKSIFSNSDEPQVVNVDLYILDVQDKLFYIINNNT